MTSTSHISSGKKKRLENKNAIYIHRIIFRYSGGLKKITPTLRHAEPNITYGRNKNVMLHSSYPNPSAESIFFSISPIPKANNQKLKKSTKPKTNKKIHIGYLPLAFSLSQYSMYNTPYLH